LGEEQHSSTHRWEFVRPRARVARRELRGRAADVFEHGAASTITPYYAGLEEIVTVDAADV